MMRRARCAARRVVPMIEKYDEGVPPDMRVAESRGLERR